MTDTVLQHTRAQGVEHIELARPERRNALREREYDALAELLAAAAPSARAVVLSGRGASFCAGNDLAEFATAWPQPPHGPVWRFLVALAACPCPVLAAVHGAAVGIGATLLLHCDVVVARRDAFLAFPFLQLGIAVEGGSSLLLPARVGHLRAMDVLLSGRKLPADEALACGLVTTVVEDDPVAAALARADAIAALPPAAVRATKRQLAAFAAPQLPRVFEDEIVTINELLALQRAAGDGGAAP